MKVSYLSLIILFLLSCHPQKYTPYYSRNLPYNRMIANYNNSEIYLNTNLKSFISKIDTISKEDIPEDIKLSGTVRCQPLINENGEILSIITLLSLNPLYDSSVINSVKNYKFKPVKDSLGNPVNYSVIVDYYFYKGSAFYPYVNFTDTYHFVRKPEKGQLPFLNNMDLNMYCYDPILDEYFQRLYKRMLNVWEWPVYYFREYPTWGRTVLAVKIRNDGTLIDYEVLLHEGNDLLEISSIDLIKSTFPFDRLPEEYTKSDLTFLLTFNYPSLEELSYFRKRK